MSNPTVAFFGATGDCAGYCLADTLNAGFNCIALARTPAKLTKSMKEKGVSPETLDRQLTIVEGNVKDVDAVKRSLQLNGKVVDKIVSGIGGVPALQWSIVKPVILTDPTICQDAGATILKALQELQPAKKPLFINVSTTGITHKDRPNDVPMLFWALYFWLLQVPHADKEVLEHRLAEQVAMPDSQRAIAAYVNVKPSLLLDGPGRGLEKVREGAEENPAIGYTIQRKDVGAWMFERLVKGDVKPGWRNKGVSITY